MSVQELAVGSVPCLAVRVTYVGELGWELYRPAELVSRCGRRSGTRGASTAWSPAATRRSTRSAREGLPSLGTDISPEDTPFEAGLGFAVQLEKGDFLGRDALSADVERQLCCLALEDPRAVALGSRPVRVEGTPVGRVTTGGYGYSVERSIAYAYLPAVHAAVGVPVEIEIFGRWIAAEVVAEPLYDPQGERIRADSRPREAG